MGAIRDRRKGRRTDPFFKEVTIMKVSQEKLDLLNNLRVLCRELDVEMDGCSAVTPTMAAILNGIRSTLNKINVLEDWEEDDA